MNTEKIPERRRLFVVLVPHRDAVKTLNEYRQKLFSMGVPGAYSFPSAAPLAELSTPLSRNELKEMAGKIREITGAGNGKINGMGTAIAATKPELMSFFGPGLDFQLGEELSPAGAREKAMSIISPTVLCAALTGISAGDVPGDNATEMQNCPAPPALSFRAAALANLAILPLGSGKPDYSFEWKMSEPVWLPAYRKAKNG